MIESHILMVVLAPLIAFVIPILLLQRNPRAAQAVVLTCSVISCGAALVLFLHNDGSAQALRTVWLASGDFKLEFGFLVDPTSRLMGLIVTLITLCVQVYSIGYMADDPGKTRYFALLSFFAWAMLSFVYALNLMQVFIFWELVGLASFFLIGFWFEKPAAAAAARKAMIMTRIGDIGFFAGMALLLRQVNTFDLPTILDPHSGLIAAIPQGHLTFIVLLIFLGIMGKSAQFPLHTWLPSAMEGPTPVSALLHSATMVAAGVYLMIRMHPIMIMSPTAMTVILCIATFTMILASTVAMVEKDIKRVLAYSSISQLSFMLMGLAAGSAFGGIFHLTTHAFFKALLFLCAGSYIHHAHSNDMTEIAQAGGNKMRVTTLGLIVGACALAGLPPLSGFFSKESIIAALSEHGRFIYVAGALFGAFLTAYYSFRMIFLVNRPAPSTTHTDPHAHASNHHAAHGEAPRVMLAPILFLTIMTALLGFLGNNLALGLGLEEAHPQLTLMIAAIGLALGGALFAWYDFGRAAATRIGFIAAIPPLRILFENAWFVDAFYARIVGSLVAFITRISEIIEVIIMDGTTDGMGDAVADTGVRASKLQSGWMQFYLGSSVAVVAGFLIYLGMK